MEKSYLFKINGVVVERIQHLWLRVALAIHGDSDLNLVKETYDLMSQKYFIHATPTLFNAGTNKQQLSSCYLLAMESDSLEGIYDTLKDCARISKWSGGIGLHIHNIRGKNSLIRGTNGQSTGIVPMLTVFEKTARFINQGTKRNGSFSIYLEPWHPDIEDFLNLKKNHGDEDMRARFMFYGLWVPDLFMEKVRENESWCLFCPSECPGLDNVIGEEFKALYEKYELEGKQRTKMLARDLWYKILDAQMETGTPYLLFKDQCNRKSNQQNLGTIKSSNLCTEIIEYSDDTESAVCNLASISLPAFVDSINHTFNYEALHKVVKTITTNLNKIIDINFYPTVKTKKSNLLHRPIGIGVQGLADAFILMDIPFYSEEAKTVNKNIFETMYHASLEKSNELARERSEWFVPSVQKMLDDINYSIDEFIKDKPLFEKVDFNENINYAELIQYRDLTLSSNYYHNRCGSYSSFNGSPVSEGKLQFDLWNHEVTNERYDWTNLKEKICEYGLRNSLLIAPMPTASTSQILGNNECFEPLTSNMYSRSTLAGEFIMANKYLMNDLIKLDMWNEKIKNNIIANNGSIQHILTIPEKIRDKYKIVWEIPMKHLIDMSADRGVFICQSQSLNLWQEDPNYKTLTSMHFYSWKKGLKTGIYYLRRKAKHQAQQFTVEPVQQQEERDEICEMCSA
jgi:ribonucleotide reductase alpha subunit